MPTVLISGFEPFQGATLNPSWEIARSLHGQTVHGHRIEAVRLPCVFSHQATALRRAVEINQPAIVLAMGLAAGRAELSFERIAINVIDPPIPDNEGELPQEAPVVAAGPSAYFSTLPLRAMVAACRQAGVPARVSNTAGTYVCNQVFYLLQHALAERAVPSGFLHVPLLPAQAIELPGNPCMSLELQCAGVIAALSQALNDEQGVQSPPVGSGGRRPSLEGRTD